MRRRKEAESAGFLDRVRGMKDNFENEVAQRHYEVGQINAVLKQLAQVSARVPAPNIRESHSETRVREYPFSTPFRHTKGY